MSNPRKNKTRKRYSKGELNRLVDSLLHPLTDHRLEVMLIDALLHGLIE